LTQNIIKLILQTLNTKEEEEKQVLFREVIAWFKTTFILFNHIQHYSSFIARSVYRANLPN